VKQEEYFGNDIITINKKKWNWSTFKSTEGFPVSNELLDWVIGQNKALAECFLWRPEELSEALSDSPFDSTIILLLQAVIQKREKLVCSFFTLARQGLPQLSLRVQREHSPSL